MELSTLLETPFGVAYAGSRWSNGPAGENMAADLSLVQTLNIRLLYKVVESMPKSTSVVDVFAVMYNLVCTYIECPMSHIHMHIHIRIRYSYAL